MRDASFSKQFERDVRAAEKRGKDMNKLKRLMVLLLEGQVLPASYRDHPLKGKWVSFRDAHLEPDWLVLYKIAGETVRFERTGRHSDLFNE